MSSVEKLTSVLNSLKLSSKSMKEDKDFAATIVTHVQAERKVLPKVLPTLIEMVRTYPCSISFSVPKRFLLGIFRQLKQERILLLRALLPL